MRFFKWLKEVIQTLCGTAPRMTIVVKRNPGLRHQECDGGAVTLETDRTKRKNIVSCSRCGATAEFDLIYERLFGYTLEDGKQRNITIRRYRDRPIKGCIHLVTEPALAPSLPYALP